MSFCPLVKSKSLHYGMASLVSSVVLLSGCALQSTAPESNAFATNASISGRAYGGNQPISGGTVNLYAVGTTGYGLGATLLATTTSAVGTGAFAFTQSSAKTGADNPVDATYGCPTSSSLLYVTIASGDPTSAGTPANLNSHIKLIDALGPCTSTASNFYDVTEVSTVVTLAALQQYINPVTEVIGSPSTTLSTSKMSRAVTGIANAFALVQTLLTQNVGTVPATVTQTSSVGTVTITPEVAKINTIADVIAACVNTTGSSSAACTQISAAATPPQTPSATNFPTPYANAPSASDTLQMALFMLQNPTNAGTQVSSCSFGTATTNIACLYAAVTASAPFVGLSTQPTDWTVGATYGSNTTVAGTGVYLLNYPTYLAVDALGNVWVLNDVSTSATGTTNSVTELGPTGSPVVQALTGSTLIGPNWIALDPSGNAWVANYGSASTLQSSVVEYTAGGATNTFTTNKGPQRLAIDGKGDVFVLEPSYKGLGDLEEIASGAATGTSASTLAAGLTTDFSNLAIDSNYSIWISGGGTGASGGTTGYPYIYQFLYSSSSPNYASAPNGTTNVGGIVSPEQGITIDNKNDVLVTNYSTPYSATGPVYPTSVTFSEIAANSTATSYAAVAGTPYTPFPVANSTSTTNPGLDKAQFQMLDGAGNVWVANMATTSATPPGSIFEMSSAGVALSPQTGYAHTYNEPDGIAIDPSGNVWVAAYNSSASVSVQSFITEIIGAAVPVVTPLAAGLPTTPGGTSYLATTPQ